MCEVLLLDEFAVLSKRIEHFIRNYTKTKTGQVNYLTMRRSSKSHLGDYTLAAAMVKRLKLNYQHEDKENFREAVITESNKWCFPIKSCSLTDQGILTFRLQRPSVFKRVLSLVLHEQDNYGKQLSGSRCVVAVVSSCGSSREILEKSQVGEGSCDQKDAISLSQLRGFLLTEHVIAVLQAAGFVVKHITSSPSTQAMVHFGSGKSMVAQEGSLTQSEHFVQETTQRMAAAATPFPFRSDASLSAHEIQMASRESNRLSSSPEPDTESMVNNCQSSCDDGSPSSVSTRCSVMEEQMNCPNPKVSHLPVVHVTSQEAAYQQQQQLDLTRRLCTGETTVCHHHLTYGRVTAQRNDIAESIGATGLYNIRLAQMREASILKYGKEVKGEGWEQLINTLTAAGLKFEILGKQCRHLLKLDLSKYRNGSTWANGRDGVFVMYNYARLCTLFRRFEDCVSEGTYQPLPDISLVDFGLLREDQEWGLVFHYILRYPEVLAKSVGTLGDGTRLQVDFQTHTICRFLADLCRHLSSYYSHTHILGEPRPHLAATMYARLYLMKAVQVVLRNGLLLMGIEPVKQM